MKVARTVLRGLGGSNTLRLPDLIEILLKLRSERKFKKAEAHNLNAQANTQIVENWVGWSQKLENRVKELEGCNSEMRETVIKQRERIGELEKHVGELEKCNKKLTDKLEELNKEKHGSR